MAPSFIPWATSSAIFAVSPGVDLRLKSSPITRLRTVAWPTIVITLTVAGALSRSSRYAAIGQGESPSGPRTSVVMPCEICVSASGSVASPSVEWLWTSMNPGARTSFSPRTTRSPSLGASLPTSTIRSPCDAHVRRSRAAPRSRRPRGPPRSGRIAAPAGGPRPGGTDPQDRRDYAKTSSRHSVIGPLGKPKPPSTAPAASCRRARRAPRRCPCRTAWAAPSRRTARGACAGLLPVAELTRHAPDVVERVVLLGVDLEAALPGVDRPSSDRPDAASATPRAFQARAWRLPRLDRGLEVLPRLLHPVELQERDARVLVGDGVGRVDLEDPRKDRQRLGRPPRVGQRDAERVQRLGLVALARTARERATASFGRPVSDSSMARWRSTLSPPAPLSAAVSKARSTPVEVSLAAEHHGQVHVAELHLRVLGHDPARDRKRLVALAPLPRAP